MTALLSNYCWCGGPLHNSTDWSLVPSRPLLSTSRVSCPHFPWVSHTCLVLFHRVGHISLVLYHHVGHISLVLYHRVGHISLVLYHCVGHISLVLYHRVGHISLVLYWIATMYQIVRLLAVLLSLCLVQAYMCSWMLLPAIIFCKALCEPEGAI